MRHLVLVCLALAAVALVHCGPTGPAGGPVSGAMDVHCVAADGGAIVQETSQASCMPDGGMATPLDYGATMYNSAGADDDCKYDVSWTSTPIRQNTDVTFTVNVKSRVDSSGVTGAGLDAEVFLTNKHPAPNSMQGTMESGGGTYTIGPVLFDASGTWTVRFHIFENCFDTLDTSPHGHAAFFVTVP
jgi:hypothetical protein